MSDQETFAFKAHHAETLFGRGTEQEAATLTNLMNAGRNGFNLFTYELAAIPAGADAFSIKDEIARSSQPRQTVYESYSHKSALALDDREVDEKQQKAQALRHQLARERANRALAQA
jgi:hypothetical protein